MIFKLLGTSYWASKSLIDDLTKLSELKQQQLDALAEWFATSEKVVGLLNEDIVKTSKETEIEPNTLRDVIHVVRYTTYHWHKSKISLDELIEDFKSIEIKTEGLKKLKEFYAKIKEVRIKIAKQILRHSHSLAALPKLSDLSIVCDLRPVLAESPYITALSNSTDYKDIIDLVPVLIVGIETENIQGSKAMWVFQLPEEALKRIQDGLEKIGEQIKEIKKKYLKSNKYSI